MSIGRIAMLSAITDAAAGRKAEDIVALDVREVSSFTDTFFVATGTSDRHVWSVADAIQAALSELGESPLGIEGYDEGRWVLIDYGATIVHIFQHETRINYDLERLWSDALTIELIHTPIRSPHSGVQ
ncbi:MAG: ribosome silencing factor [Myxococcota bacterium]